MPLEEILVEWLDVQRAASQAAALRRRVQGARCELCGQGEEWRGRRMSLILDHINGVADDNRLENLRIVCPNCAATLDTHCGRPTSDARGPRVPARAARRSARRRARQRYCSRAADMRCADARDVRAAGGAARSSGRRTSSCSRRWRRRAGQPSDASTASATTRCASGCGRYERDAGGLEFRPDRSRRRPPRLAIFMRIRHARRRGRGPSRARRSGVCGRSDDAAVAGAGRDALHRLLGDPGDDDQLVRRPGARRGGRRGARASGTSWSRCPGRRWTRPGIGPGLLGLADLLPGRGGGEPQHRRDLAVGERVRRQGRAGDARSRRSSARRSTCPARRRRRAAGAANARAVSRRCRRG